MKTKHILIITAILFTLSGCFKDNFIFGINGKGDHVIEETSTEPFTKVDLALNGDLFLHQSDERKIVIEAQPNIMENIRIKVRNGNLIFNFKKNVRNHDGVYIHVYGPIIEGVDVSGSGQIIAETPIEASSFEVRVSGSGHVEINELFASRVNSKISGSGSVILSGDETVSQHELKISGSGSISSYGLNCNSVEAKISGSGSCEVAANNSLDVDISGSGSVFYRGNPSVSSDISGSGSIHNTN